MLRVCVYDDDKEIVGQRTLPVNAIRPGFRHINLRDKHGTPLPLAMIFVLITVEDWVPDEMEGGCGLIIKLSNTTCDTTIMYIVLMKNGWDSTL